jgi:hypothetical protein
MKLWGNVVGLDGDAPISFLTRASSCEYNSLPFRNLAVSAAVAPLTLTAR